MNCPGEELLKTMLDGELPEAEARELETHIAACEACRARLEEIRAQSKEASEVLRLLEPPNHEAAFDARAAYARLTARATEERTSSRPGWRGASVLGALRPGLWATLAAAALLAVVFTAFAPARTWAQRVLEMLRIQKIAVVPVNSTFLPEGNGKNLTAQMIRRLISDDVTVTMKPGPPRRAGSAATASAMAGFPVRLFADRGHPEKIEVRGEGAANMILHRDRLQRILDSAGRSDLQIPRAADGAMIAIHVPNSVVTTYGHCPPPGNGTGREASAPPAARNEDFSSCVVFYQGPSPTVSVPRDLNLPQLAQIGLEFTGMTAQQAAEFCRTVNWTSTLVIPVPRNAGSYSEAEVDGVKGALMTSRLNGHPGYTLIWVKNGMVYSIVGLGDRSQAPVLGDSLGPEPAR